MYILGLSFYYHDSSACLIKDGQIIAAAEEERFTRKKHDPAFPSLAISFCLKEAGIDINSVEYIVFYEKPFLKFERIIFSYFNNWPKGYITFCKMLNLWLTKKLRIKKTIRKELAYRGKVFFIKHHESHASSSFFSSPFKEASIVTMDGVGEWTTTTICDGVENNITTLREVEFPNSLGLFYSAFTYFLGFNVNDGEYKVMGLAPYGQPVYADLIKKELIKIFSDGSYELNQKYFKFEYGDEMINRAKFERLFSIKKRDSKEEINKTHKNIAASVQAITEEIILLICSEAKRLTKRNNVCLAGGLFLNCVANSKILEKKIFDEVFVFPASGDSGGAVGAALFTWYQILNNKRELKELKDVYWGPSFSNEYIENYLKRIDIKYKKLSEENLVREVAFYLKNQKIVGWFQGKMEFGPRALGNRSILADPRNRENWPKINKLIKFREDFRPFAPAILEDRLNDFFDFHGHKSPFMLFVAKNKTNKMPATTHVDGSSRVQTVSQEENKLFYNLISEFDKMTGMPALINTSFNLSDVPIVCTPQNAFQCFLKSGIDILVLGNYIILKEDYK